MKITQVVWPAPREVVLETKDLSDPGPGEVLIRSQVTLISPGTERAFLLALPNTTKSFPFLPGYNHVGVIEKLGDGVQDFKVGQRVVSTGRHASHVVLPATKVFPVPNGVSDEQATFWNLCVIASQAVRKTKIELGETVVALGQGVVGNLALQIAKLSGACPAVAVDPILGRRELSVKCGADMAVDPSDREHFIQQHGKAHVVLEATISAQTIVDALKWVRPRGRVSLMGGLRGETQGLNLYEDVMRPGVSLIGAHIFTIPNEDSSPGYWTRKD
jgi:L-iditol 2-dehydrogenase